MKKEIDYWATKKNIPQLDLYTKLLKLFSFYEGLNLLLAFLYARIWNISQVKELTGMTLATSIVFFVRAYGRGTDPRKDMRNKAAVVREAVVHGVIALAMTYMVSSLSLLAAYILELVHVAIVINKYSSSRKV